MLEHVCRDECKEVVHETLKNIYLIPQMSKTLPCLLKRVATGSSAKWRQRLSAVADAPVAGMRRAAVPQNVELAAALLQRRDLLIFRKEWPTFFTKNEKVEWLEECCSEFNVLRNSTREVMCNSVLTPQQVNLVSKLDINVKNGTDVGGSYMGQDPPPFCGQAKALGLKSSGGSCKSWRWSPKKATKWVPISWRTTQRSAKKALRRNGSERKRLLRRRKAQHLWPRPGLALALPKLWSLISAHPQANDRLWRPAFVSTMAILEATWWQRWRWCLLKGANPSQGRHTGSHTGCLPTVELWSCSGEHQRQVLSIPEHSSHTGQWPWNHHPRQAHSLLLWATARKPWDGLWIRPKSTYPWAIQFFWRPHLLDRRESCRRSQGADPQGSRFPTSVIDHSRPIWKKKCLSLGLACILWWKHARESLSEFLLEDGAP